MKVLKSIILSLERFFMPFLFMERESRIDDGYLRKVYTGLLSILSARVSVDNLWMS